MTDKNKEFTVRGCLTIALISLIISLVFYIGTANTMKTYEETIDKMDNRISELNQKLESMNNGI
jgi:hypothetical protein